MKLFNLNTLKFLARLLLVLGWVVSPNVVWSFSDEPVHHQLKIELEPLTRFARIEDTVEFKTASENSCLLGLIEYSVRSQRSYQTLNLDKWFM